MWKKLLQRVVQDVEGRAALERWLTEEVDDCSQMRAAYLASWIVQQVSLANLDCAEKPALVMAAQWINQRYATVVILASHRLGESSITTGLMFLEAIDRLMELGGLEHSRINCLPVVPEDVCAWV
ncbi:MAG: hypothetical protein AB7E47_02980 [Desulfovibrionaceae bacterium]